MSYIILLHLRFAVPRRAPFGFWSFRHNHILVSSSGIFPT